ncbi:MAG: hypothetical protein J6D30_05340 [Clostridia bacterium]|nr:hypothetical protein [Clostridia bacterium]
MKTGSVGQVCVEKEKNMEKKTVITWIKRVAVYLIGMFLIAFGSNVAIESDLGVSPVNSIPLVLSLRFPTLTLGTWVTIIFSLFVLVQLVMLRKDFKWYYIFQFAVSTVFGWFVDGTAVLSAIIFPNTEIYILRIVYVLVSIVFIAAGILLYLEGDIMSMPAEGVTVAMTKVFKKPLSTCKLIFDVTIVLIAVILSFVFFAQLSGVREGTVMIAIGVGVVMKPLAKWCKKPLHTFVFGKTENEKRDGAGS